MSQKGLGLNTSVKWLHVMRLDKSLNDPCGGNWVLTPERNRHSMGINKHRAHRQLEHAIHNISFK